MADEKFAFESNKISVAFYSLSGLGDVVIARKVLTALIELAPDCVVDFFCVTEAHKSFASAFYGDIKNLNRILNYQKFYKQTLTEYDMALGVGGCHLISLEQANIRKLQKKAPKLFDALVKVSEYNRQFNFNPNFWETVALHNMIAAEILNKNCYSFLSCDGALPIRDDKVTIPLLTAYKPKFDALKLGRYITIYSNVGRNEARPKVKTWPIKYFIKYVARMKKIFPQLEIVQCGGRGDIKIENADRHIFDADLELVKHVLKNSLLHVDCESGLVHLATQLGTKCLVLFGPTDEKYYGFKENLNIVSDVCRPCVWAWDDGNKCLRGAKEPPCMLSITPQLVCEVTCNYLKHLDLKNNA